MGGLFENLRPELRSPLRDLFLVLGPLQLPVGPRNKRHAARKHFQTVYPKAWLSQQRSLDAIRQRP